MKNINYFVISYFTVILSYSYAQKMQYEWIVKSSQYPNNLSSVKIDEKNNIYALGDFSGIIRFRHSPNNIELLANGFKNNFIQKIDTNGNTVWAKKFGGKFNDFTGESSSKSLVIDKNSNLYITGSFKGIVDFDPSANIHSLTSGNFDETFVMKLDSSGRFIWAKKIGYRPNNPLLTTDNYGQVYFVDTYNGSIYIDNDTIANSESFDIFILKISSEGDFIWNKTIGGKSVDLHSSISISNQDEIILTGGFSDIVDFDLGPMTFLLNEKTDGRFFIQKLDLNGNLIWVKSIGDKSFSIFSGSGIKSLSLDQFDNIHITGAFEDTLFIDPSDKSNFLISEGLHDIFLAKYNSNGQLLWSKSLGSKSDDLSQSIFVSSDSKIYLTGSFSNTVDFDLGSNIKTHFSNDLENNFILITDENAEYIWSDSFGKSRGKGLFFNEDNSGKMYLSGSLEYSIFQSQTSVSFIMESTSRDIFTMKLGLDNITDVDKQINSVLSVYPNPASLYTKVQGEGRAQLELLNLQGHVLKNGQLNEEFSVKDLESGVYLIKVSSDIDSRILKLLVD